MNSSIMYQHLKMRMILCGCLLLAFGSVWVHATHNRALGTAWEDWKSTHQKEYLGLGEENIRRTIWEKNMQLIEAHNQEYELGMHTYKLGMNHLGDMEKEEVVLKMMGFKPHMHAEINNTFVPESRPLPNCIDYRTKGYVSPVKNQGSCGSCWAFAAAGALEGQMRKKVKKLVPLSPQNLVDCSTKNRGCRGGKVIYAFDYIRRNGIASDKVYPYTGKTGECVYTNSMKAATCKDFKIIHYGDEDSLAKAVAQVGPIAVALDASQPTFTFYKAGIYSDFYCQPDKLTHALLVVGYTSLNWIVKNSWGRNWGENGYIRIKRGKNVCGIANEASYPVV